MEIMSAAARNILQHHQEPGEPDDVPPLEGDPDVPPPGGDPPAPGPEERVDKAQDRVDKVQDRADKAQDRVDKARGQGGQGTGTGVCTGRPTKHRRETRALDPNAIIATKLRSYDRR